MKRLVVLWGLLVAFSVRATIPAKVIICGVCRDVAARVPFSMKTMEKIGALFADYRIIVYENNSSDRTPQLLAQWQKKNAKVRAISERIAPDLLNRLIINRDEHKKLFRPEAIARARNVVLEQALSDAYHGFDYLIWMDMDFKLEPNYAGFQEIFASEQTWDAVFAYGVDPRGEFWDWYALRHDPSPLGSEILGHDWWYLPKQLHLTLSDPWYPVSSAFGGCGVYRKEAVKDCRYSALVTNDLARVAAYFIYEKYNDHPHTRMYLENLATITQLITIHEPSSQLPDITDKEVGILTDNLPEGIVWRMSSFTYKYPTVCEHVTLHASMIVRGYDKLFINPRLLFRYGG